MDDLIGRLAADVGIDRAAAEKSVGIILDFLVREGPADDAVADDISAIIGLARRV